MSWIAILKYLPYVLSLIKAIMDHIKKMDSEEEKQEFLKKLGDAFENAKSGDTSNIEQLLNGK